MCGLGLGEETADLKLFSFFSLSSEPTLVFTSRPVSFMGRVWEWESGKGHGRGEIRKWGEGGWGDDCAARAALLVSSMAADTCSASSAPPTPIHPGGHPASVCSVPCLSGDQGLTNDVYAVVLVDICWQNRSPVRHLEWN